MTLSDEQIYGTPPHETPPKQVDHARVVSCRRCGLANAIVNGSPRRCIRCGEELPHSVPLGDDVTR